jgi:glutathione synthase/RimK-type ligase-like ATP-grasp enzyme
VTRIALATSAGLPELDPDSQLLLPAFEAIGVDARPVVWSDPAVDWTAYDAVVLRSTWDYFEREAEFLDWVERTGATAKRFVNPPDLVAWNAHKTYLRELGEQGVPVVDTQWIAQGDTATVEHAQGIVKPAVSGGAFGLQRASAGDTIAAGVDLLIQPFLDSIVDEGELSLFYAAGAFTHMVRKVPARGDIRVQPEYGGAVRPEDPSPEAREAGQQVLDAIGRELPYARVDLVRAQDDTLRLIELEIIEPQLYLRWAPEHAATFASAIADAARSA